MLTRKTEDGRNWARFTFWVAGAALMLYWLTVMVTGSWPAVKAQVGKAIAKLLMPKFDKVTGWVRLLIIERFPPERGVWVAVRVFVAVFVGVAVAVLAGVSVGESVTVEVGVWVSVKVIVSVNVLVAVSVGVEVLMGVSVGESVTVGVDV